MRAAFFRLFVPFAIGLMLAACDSTSVPETREPSAITNVESPARMASEWRLALGETRDIRGLSVSFTSLEDSRCPQDAVCGWSGMAWIGLTMDGWNGSEDITKTLIGTVYSFTTEFIEYDDTRFQVVSLNPYPGSPAAYRGDTPTLYIRSVNN
ncbi:MAG: hypothetical protein Rubg2KO_10480 [Rubricoccaceae bacterium]